MKVSFTILWKAMNIPRFAMPLSLAKESFLKNTVSQVAVAT
jgi:hypothetical protein